MTTKQELLADHFKGDVLSLKADIEKWYMKRFGKGVTMPTDKQVMHELVDHLISTGVIVSIAQPTPQPASAALEALERVEFRLDDMNTLSEKDEIEHDKLGVQTIRQALAQCVWQPIETVPEDEEVLILFDEPFFGKLTQEVCLGCKHTDINDDGEEVGLCFAKGPWANLPYKKILRVKGWMPLPAAPVVKGE